VNHLRAFVPRPAWPARPTRATHAGR